MTRLQSSQKRPYAKCKPHKCKELCHHSIWERFNAVPRKRPKQQLPMTRHIPMLNRLDLTNKYCASQENPRTNISVTNDISEFITIRSRQTRIQPRSTALFITVQDSFEIYRSNVGMRNGPNPCQRHERISNEEKGNEMVWHADRKLNAFWASQLDQLHQLTGNAKRSCASGFKLQTWRRAFGEGIIVQHEKMNLI